MPRPKKFGSSVRAGGLISSIGCDVLLGILICGCKSCIDYCLRMSVTLGLK